MSQITNCKNCGAILSSGRYCSYCGADTGRTEHIDMHIDYTPTVVPLVNIRCEIELPNCIIYKNSEDFEDKIKYDLVKKAVSTMVKNLVIHKCEDIIKDTTKYATTIKFGSY